MKLNKPARALTLSAVVLFLAMAAGLLLRPYSAAALPDYAAKTGQPCSTCHINPAGGGPLTATGTSFAAIATHTTDPAGAFAQVQGAAQPSPAPAPAAGGPVSVTIAGAQQDDSVVYSINLTNTGDKGIVNVYVAGSIPAGASFTSAVNTPDQAGFAAGGPSPVSAGFVGSQGGAAAWVLDTVPAKGSVGPFVYKVSKGSAADLSASAFVHWLQPNDGTATSASITPLSNSERLATDQAVNDKLNSLDRSLLLWNLQPGLGTVMIEYSIRFANMWFAAQAGNWDMTRYQVAEMTEIQEVGETTRPGRFAALKNFEDTYLDPIDEAAAAQDLTAFTAAYDSATAACNSCHASAGGLPPTNQLGKFIKITRPSAPVFPNVDFKGQ